MEKPIGKAIILCDQVIDDLNTRKKTLVGIFTSIRASQFPTKHPTLSVYVALTNGSGDVKVKLVLKRDSTKESAPMFAAEGNVKFENPNQVIELVFNLIGLTFARPGQYVFEVHANSGYIFESKFDVFQLKAQPKKP